MRPVFSKKRVEHQLQVVAGTHLELISCRHVLRVVMLAVMHGMKSCHDDALHEFRVLVATPSPAGGSLAVHVACRPWTVSSCQLLGGPAAAGAPGL